MTQKYSIRAAVAGGLATILLASSCATPNGIKARRYLGSQGKLNSGTFTEFSADDKDAVARAGIYVNFNTAKELKEGAIGAIGALGYGLIRPAYSEFWHASNPEKLEYSGFAPFTKAGYQNGRKAETVGELSRYFAIIYGVAQGLSHKGSSNGSESRSSGPTTTTTTTTTSGNGDNGVTPTTIPVTPTTTIPPVNPPETDGDGNTTGY